MLKFQVDQTGFHGEKRVQTSTESGVKRTGRLHLHNAEKSKHKLCDLPTAKYVNVNTLHTPASLIRRDVVIDKCAFNLID